MMMEYIGKRVRSLDRKFVFESSFENIDIIKNNCIKSPNFNNILKLARHTSIDITLNESLSIIENYYKEYKPKNINTILREICENLKYENNMNYSENLINNFLLETGIEYDNFKSTIEKYKTVDRIIENHNRIENRFDIDKFIDEYKLFSEDDKITLVEELCFKIDSFNCDKELKYNLALENIFYILNKKGIHINEELLLDTITEYFLISDVNIDLVLENNIVYTEKAKFNVLSKTKKKVKSKAMQLLDKIKHTEIKTPEKLKPVIRAMYSQSAHQVLEDIPNFLIYLRTFLTFSTFAVQPYLGLVVMAVDQFISFKVRNDEADRMVKKFKTEKERAENKLYRLTNEKSKENLEKYIDTLDKQIEKLEEYRDNLRPEGGYDEMEEITIERQHMMDYLNEGVADYIPYFITESSFFERFNVKTVKNFNNMVCELTRYNEQNILLKGKIKIQDRMVPYTKSINGSSISESLDGEGHLYLKLAYIPDLEGRGSCLNNISKKLDKGYFISTENTDEGSNVYLTTKFRIDGVEPAHKDLLETAYYIQTVEETLQFILNNNRNVVNGFRDCVDNLDSGFIKEFVDTVTINDLISNSEIKEILEDSSFDETDNENKKILNDIEYKWYPINKSESIYRLFAVRNNIEVTNECFNMICEGGATRNNLLIAKEKLRKNVVKLSDKDKEYSKRLDNILSNLINKTQKNLTNKNREAVIKGSILPSFSAAIKLAMASTAATIINPVLGIITMVGGLAASKIGTEKERDYILDEIEIELRLVDKKIQLAERNDDTKALEQLYKIEKALKREQTRIKYNKKDFRPIYKD